MAEKRQYTEDDKATALAALTANGGNVTRTAEELGIPASTLRKWRDGEGTGQGVTQKCDQKKEELHSLFEEAARVYLGRALKKAAVDKTTGKDAIIAAATATDKMRLLREQPTSIPGDGLSESERLVRVAALLDGARARRNGHPTSGGAANDPGSIEG